MARDDLASGGAVLCALRLVSLALVCVGRTDLDDMVSVITFFPRVTMLVIIVQYTAAMFTERSSGSRSALRKMV